jgi:hypothetical protein
LKGYHTPWFYCENYKPNLPPFICNLPEFGGSWTEESTYVEMSVILALAEKVNKLKQLRLTGVSMFANWLACQVIPLK